MLYTPKMVFELSNLNLSDIKRILNDSGYGSEDIFDADFNGLNENANFCYIIYFKDDGRTESGFIYIYYNPVKGKVEAEF